MQETELPAADLEFQRDCYVQLLERENDDDACRAYLRRIHKLDEQIAARERSEEVEALVEVPIVLTEQIVAPPVRCVEVEVTTQPPVEDGIEIEIVELGPDDGEVELETTRWKPADGDFFETMDTALYQRITAPYRAVPRRSQPGTR